MKPSFYCHACGSYRDLDPTPCKFCGEVSSHFLIMKNKKDFYRRSGNDNSTETSSTEKNRKNKKSTKKNNKPAPRWTDDYSSDDSSTVFSDELYDDTSDTYDKPSDESILVLISRFLYWVAVLLFGFFVLVVCILAFK